MIQFQILSKDYLLRKSSNGHFFLYNKRKCVKYTISSKLFKFLYLYKEGNYNLDVMLQYLSNQNIEIDDIKEFLRNEDFLDLLVSTNNRKTTDENIYQKLRKISPYTEYSPERIDLLITKHCNLNCKHCFENASPSIKNGNIPLDKLFGVFQQMDALNVRTLKITGGEPLTYPHIKEILEEISNKRFECIILTNGILLDSELIDIMSRGSIKLGISLDGYKEESHDFLRGRGSFNKLMIRLNDLKNANINFSITMSVNRMNYLEIEDLTGFSLNTLGAKRIFINQLKPLGRAKINENIFLSEEEYKEVIIRVENLIKTYGDGKITLSDDTLLSEDDDIIIKDKLSNTTPLVCAAGNNSISIDENLDVFPCVYGNGLLNYRIGNLKEDNLLSIWLSDKWGRFRGETTLGDIEGCKTCSHNASCGMKNCRLKPVYNGQSFFSHVSYCNQG